MRKLLIPEEILIDVFGHYDEHLRAIERDLGVQVAARGTEVTVQGEPEKEALAANLVGQLIGIVQSGYSLKKGDVEIAARLLRDNRSAVLQEFFAAGRLRATNGRYVTPKGLHQRLYLDAIRDHDLVFSIGPAGTGKTYLAVAAAVAHLTEKKVDRIILCRPAVEAGEKLGFLPGDMAEKVDPYFRPLYDALYHLLDRERANAQMERGAIEIAPLAFMRGRTLSNSFVILDEAQNTTSEQMKMFLTRLGSNSKAVITGDITQVDLPPGRTSGLIEAQTVVVDVPGIRFVYFDESDVVRHPLVQGIIKAYEAYRNGRTGAAAPPAAPRRPAPARRPRTARGHAGRE
ncbi:MAG TPA: PhoH family protein [Candidatus Polarisedimenticolia bacterium]|nr:PhoH family protein [Candidatus Polarisedimenticolia bacterium]